MKILLAIICALFCSTTNAVDDQKAFFHDFTPYLDFDDLFDLGGGFGGGFRSSTGGGGFGGGASLPVGGGRGKERDAESEDDDNDMP